MTPTEIQLADDIGSFSRNPLGFCKYAFEWGEGSLSDATGVRPWQAEVMNHIKSHLSNPSTRFQPCQVAVSSGHGIGKSALISMVVDWALSTCEDCRILLTANTENQLRTKTWPEISKWFHLSINSHWWSVNATSITVQQKKHEKLWRADATPWSEHNTEAFAGLHNKGKRIVVVYDEASKISDKIWEVTEGALTDENTEIIWLAFGNPTQNTGRFRECFGRFKHRWKTFQIDSRTVEGTNKAQIDKWVEDFGEDSDFVRIRVRGEFPRAGTSQFISADAVALCRKYKAEGYEALPKILSVDVARFGDDQTVICIRQGRKLRILAKLRGLGTVQVAERIIEWIGIEDPNAIVIDGDGIGGGVVDQLKHRGYDRNLHEFHGGARADDAAMYFNRRAEVWGMMREWLNAGAEIPNDPELDSDLTGVEYYFSRLNQLQLERKEDMKSRGLGSPDIGDAIAYSFSVKIAAPRKLEAVEIYAGSDGWMG